MALGNMYPVCQKILHSFSARLPQFRTQVSIFHKFLAFHGAMAFENPCQDFLQSWVSRLLVKF
jgi:hypothetical protein